MTPTHDPLLVLFSVLVAILAAYTGLDLASRVSSAQGRAAHAWLLGSGVAMGIGIWSMHFVGMLAFQLPIPLGYDPLLTVVSLLVAVGASAFALWLVCQKSLTAGKLLLGAVLMGSAVAGMHYTGMAAMQMRPGIDYDPALVALSVAIAVVASGAALWIAFQLRQRVQRFQQAKLGAAIVMGLAIASMHYTGMAAADFLPGSVCLAAGSGLDGNELALPILLTTIFVLAIALLMSVLDMRMEMRTAVLAESLAQANAELTFLALHDKLTKLPNRALLEDRFEQAIQSAARMEERFAVMFVDLDGFKGVNDAYGHQAGDQLLIEVANRIRSAVRAEDTVSRVGGDEFVLLARVKAPEDAGELANRLLLSLREPISAAGQSLNVSGSIGIAVYPEDGTEQRELMRHADAAMYHAKGLGRDGFSFFEPSMNQHAQAQQSLAQDLRVALRQGGLELHYQPKVAAPNNRVLGAEALLRWNHPTLGMVSPDTLIPLAERTGLIVPLGQWVLNTACEQLAKWHAHGNTDWTMSVNLSALQFADPHLVEMVRSAISRHRLNPGRLILEITESVAMRDVDLSLAVLQQLHDMGVRIAIDDFGTGYSSLLYLKRIPACELKIDRGFVRDLKEEGEDAAIVSAIIALGQTLKLNIVAEGVETAAQQDFLTRLGCDMLQGYLLGKPVPADEFPDGGSGRLLVSMPAPSLA
ncbi:bifunctional diguanylate cyclase/phosphodiesterase [Cupriavidus sp. AU9028]|uniref:putative bifunctional diguanylate cyclase/phosphodiesterase n=1 Tax=Cupriavidus sp. AU9028 TaxID=2871157 RepID=UPI001C975A20|nr:bifunctional diguanylate cyclase/phosphodiesterase [Cupriavidus sp. AU9028]MBY4898291.1 EAL domain-containing protein [Cupriavidus sp. AU9028]